FLGSGMGWPFASTPFAQFVFTNSVLTRFFPVARSSTKNHPFRLACASSLRRAPLISPSKSIGDSMASQSCVSWGHAWKYRTSLDDRGRGSSVIEPFESADFLMPSFVPILDNQRDEIAIRRIDIQRVTQHRRAAIADGPSTCGHP